MMWLLLTVARHIDQRKLPPPLFRKKNRPRRLPVHRLSPPQPAVAFLKKKKVTSWSPSSLEKATKLVAFFIREGDQLGRHLQWRRPVLVLGVSPEPCDMLLQVTNWFLGFDALK